MLETPLARATMRIQTAQQILADLRLIEQWSTIGKPIVVGAVAYGVPVAPDIDMEIFCATPRIEDGFQVALACALHPRVRKVRFSNELAGPDQGLYWQVRYAHEDGEEWKIDMWLLAHDHPGPYAAALVEPMQRALTGEIRQAILAIKEQKLLDPTLTCGSIHIYRAVLGDGVRTTEQFREWLAHHDTNGLVDWKPQLFKSGHPD